MVDSAARPEAKAKPYAALSIVASLSSNAFLVGFKDLEYSYPAVGTSTSLRAKVVAKCNGMTASPVPPSLKFGSSPACIARVSNFPVFISLT
jgi:hypothetical protein